MAKRKKKKKNQKRRANQGRSGSGVRWFEKQMAQVRVLYQAEAYEEALKRLFVIRQKYARHPMVLSALADVNIELKNWQQVVIYSEQLYPLERGNERATTLNNLMNAYMELMLPALAWKTASMLVADHPDFHFIERAQQFAQGLKPLLFKSFGQVALLAERFDGDQDAMFDFIVEHDRMRFLAESNQQKEAILHCQRLLDKLPGFIPALNNMSLAYFTEGDLDKAIEATQEVLAQQPDNYHALANLARYSFLSGESDAAWRYATQLKRVESNEPQRWAKQAEALAYLGDDEGVRDAYLESEANDPLKSELLLHLGAAAHYRLGDESKAWQLWQEALRIRPTFDMAKNSLAERRKAPGERDVGWYWPLTYWFAGDLKRSYLNFPAPTSHQGTIKKAVQKFLKQYPQLPLLLPHILDRGDSDARKTMLLLIELIGTEELVQALVPFGSGKSGTDAQRMKALQIVTQHHPHLLPADRKISVWHKGEQTEIMMLAFAISGEPEETMLDDKTFDLYQKANGYLVAGRHLKRAEQLYIKVIDAYPDYPSVYNQLAMVYELQGRKKEAKKLVEQTHRRFPDYTFARMGLARMALRENRTEEAREYLNPVLQQQELHTSEFRMLAQAEMEYSLAMGEPEGARSWLSMWEQVEEDHPDLPKWKAIIENRNSPDKRRRLVRKLLQEMGL